jgi:glyoxylase-like metal-dependent hydrolase (beta-lactamase superfamily II)
LPLAVGPTIAVVDDRLYFRQLLSGRDFARTNMAAQQMVNFVYLVGDRATGEAVIVDPAYDVAELMGILEADGMRLTGALATHYHPDHVGGSFMGISVEGVKELLALPGGDVPIHVNGNEAWGVKRVTGCSDTDLRQHDGGDVLTVGEIPVTFLHTPGHTPGSQCFLVDGRLVSGDTLFLEGCGRVDLPGASADQMYDSLNTVLGALPASTVVYPGHLYSVDPSASMEEIRRTNYVYRFRTRDQFLTMFGMG